MTEEGAQVQPDAGAIAPPFRPRGTYAGYRAFGSGDGAVLVEPGVIHELRAAAELAAQDQRCTGGLVFGRRWADDQGVYLVVSGFVEAGPAASGPGRVAGDSRDDFTLPEAELRVLRADAGEMYPASYEVGWWRTLAALGEFGPGDLATQAELAAPDGVGLLVYGSGIHWGTAYLGPDGHAPDSAGTLVVAAGPYPADPGPAGDPEPAFEPDSTTGPGPEVIDIAAGESLLADEGAFEEEPLLAADFVPPAPAARQAGRRGRPAGQARQWASSRVRVPTRVRGRGWRGRRADAGYRGADRRDETYPGQELPADAQLVAIALALTCVAAAIIVGFLVHSLIVALVIGAVGLLAVAGTVWMSRYHS